jgi:hypothetical protein
MGRSYIPLRLGVCMVVVEQFFLSFNTIVRTTDGVSNKTKYVNIYLNKLFLLIKLGITIVKKPYNQNTNLNLAGLGKFQSRGKSEFVSASARQLAAAVLHSRVTHLRT